ncbi:polysaccharide pyruvyl transferase family protein [Anaeromicropila herbilytica]|uniref:Polysaccharide pyruvyl transferase domain-containing protein n=1 Tax=Anaeromicropila herbilytica TaxID=2785025 RepID=A0A7R7ICE1_9FIRM|nr:polysaccharide pyruvyl transferase family protein [Anaeromicropila herbilytica]BCN28853.1 hypothetical protein bsdtb5_01480 [Anaeromicropila herbilytica]
MKRILIRAGMSPIDNFDPVHIILNNSIGGNVGNLIYAYSIFRTLTTPDTILEPNYYKIDPNSSNEINEKYDAFVIPLADAFREDFIPELRKYTKLINKLSIPVYVIGVGLKAPFEPKISSGFSFDEDVKEFVTAVLEHSNIIGVRGQITSDYLTHLGFREGIDHMVIGCPSMYTFGPKLTIRDTTITKDSKVSINNSKLSPNNVLDFIKRSTKEFSDYYFIPQWMKELKLSYFGYPSINNMKSNYPCQITDEIYQEGRVRFFHNLPTWVEFLKTVDLSFGARLHGNITSTIAGTPSIIIPKDARMRELAMYHNLTHVMANEINDSTSIWDLIEKADFKSPMEVQARNFANYIDFLNMNHIDHIYKECLTPSIVPLDEQLKTIEYVPPTIPITSLSQEEALLRLEKYHLATDTLIENQKNTIYSINRKLNTVHKQLEKEEALLNRRSVKLALSFANKINRIK